MKQLIPSWLYEQLEREKREAEQRLADVKRRIALADLAPLVDAWLNEGGR